MAGEPIGLLLSLTYASGSTPPPAKPKAGWVPKQAWKPSKSVNREVRELLRELTAKAQDLAPAKKARVQETVQEVREAIAPSTEITEDDAKQLIDLMRTAVSASSIRSMLDWTRQLEIAALAIKTQDEEDEEELLMLLH